MRRILWRSLAVALLTAMAGGMSGCGMPNLLAYPWAPRDAKKQVAREYDLNAERLLILPFAGHDVLFEYPTAGVDISSQVTNQISENLRGHVQRVINPQQVALYQQANIDWVNKSAADIGREFKADKVLYIEVSRFTMNEEGSANLMRGRLSARLQVFDTAAGKTTPLYEGDVAVTVPDDRPLGAGEMSEDKVRYATLFRFAQDAIRKFYDHEERVVTVR